MPIFRILRYIDTEFLMGIIYAFGLALPTLIGNSRGVELAVDMWTQSMIYL